MDGAERERHTPVGLPDVQDLRVGDLHSGRLAVQEVEKVFDGGWGFAGAHAPDPPKQVDHVGVDRHLGDGRETTFNKRWEQHMQ